MYVLLRQDVWWVQPLSEGISYLFVAAPRRHSLFGF